MCKFFKSISLAALLAPLSALATPFVIDGDLSDWGVTVADNNNSEFATVRSDVIGYMIEDQNDNAGNGGYLGPNHGGQNYDGEFMGAALSGNQLVVAISTGQRSDNGFRNYSPGDLLIYTDSGVYGLEMGGGRGGTAVPFLTEGATGSTYTLNRNGYTVGYSDAAAAQVTGSLWADVDLILDPINPATAVQFEINQSSQQIGIADFVYTSTEQTNQHAIYEMAFDLDAFAGQTIDRIFWAPSCGNDELYVELDLPITVPEPLMGALLMFGMFGAFAVRRTK